MSKHIVGDADPRKRHSVVVDTRDAILLDETMACVVELGDGDGAVLALDLAGRRNRSSARGEQLFLMDGVGAAQLVAQLVAAFVRNGQGEEFTVLMTTALQANLADGLPGDEDDAEEVG